jgi:hypothetical protein
MDGTTAELLLPFSLDAPSSALHRTPDDLA